MIQCLYAVLEDSESDTTEGVKERDILLTVFEAEVALQTNTDLNFKTLLETTFKKDIIGSIKNSNTTTIYNSISICLTVIKYMKQKIGTEGETDSS